MTTVAAPTLAGTRALPSQSAWRATPTAQPWLQAQRFPRRRSPSTSASSAGTPLCHPQPTAHSPLQLGHLPLMRARARTVYTIGWCAHAGANGGWVRPERAPECLAAGGRSSKCSRETPSRSSTSCLCPLRPPPPPSPSACPPAPSLCVRYSAGTYASGLAARPRASALCAFVPCPPCGVCWRTDSAKQSRRLRAAQGALGAIRRDPIRSGAYRDRVQGAAVVPCGTSDVQSGADDRNHSNAKGPTL